MNKKQSGFVLVSVVIGGFFGGVMSQGILTIPATMAQAPPKMITAKVVRAQQFELIEEDRRTRAWLGLSASRDVTLDLAGEEAGHPTLKLVVSPDGSAALQIQDRRGPTRIKLGLTPEGSPRLVLLDDDGTARIKLELTPGGAPLLLFLDEDEQVRVGLGASAGDGPQLQLNDNNGNTRVRLGLGPADQLPFLAFQGETEEKRDELGLFPDGRSHLTHRGENKRNHEAHTSLV